MLTPKEMIVTENSSIERDGSENQRVHDIMYRKRVPYKTLNKEENFIAFRDYFLNLIKSKYPDNWQERIKKAEELVAQLLVYIVVDESNVEDIFKTGGLLPFSERPSSTKKLGGLLPEDRLIGSQNYLFGTLGKPQNRGCCGSRVTFLCNPNKIQFFTMQDALTNNNHTSLREIDFEILNRQTMSQNRLQEHFSLMIALAYDNTEDFYTDHQKMVPAFPEEGNRMARVEVELRLSRVGIQELAGIIIENPDFKQTLLNLGFPENKIAQSNGDDFCGSFAQAGKQFQSNC